MKPTQPDCCKVLATDIWSVARRAATGDEGRLNSEKMVLQMTAAVSAIIAAHIAKTASDPTVMDRLKAKLADVEASNERLRATLGKTKDELYATFQQNDTLRKSAYEKKRTRELRAQERLKSKELTAQVKQLIETNGDLRTQVEKVKSKLNNCEIENRRLKDRVRRKSVDAMPTREELVAETMASHPEILRSEVVP